MADHQRPARQADGFLRPYRIGAVVLLTLGVLCLLVELLSSSLIYWTGDRVQGTNDGGIVYYTVDGSERTLDARGAAPAKPEPVLVFVDPDDATKDRVDQPARWFDLVFVLGPFVVAGALMITGVVRRRRFRARLATAPPLPPVSPDRSGGSPPSRPTRSR